MIWLLTTTVFLLGFIIFAIDYRRWQLHPSPLRARVLNGEVVGICLMLLSLWTLAIYGVWSR